jgi:hypothetical protein
MLDQGEFEIAGLEIAGSDRTDKNKSVARSGSRNVETLLENSGSLRH